MCICALYMCTCAYVLYICVYSHMTNSHTYIQIWYIYIYMYMSQRHICYIYVYVFTLLHYSSLLSCKIATRQKSYMYMSISQIAIHTYISAAHICIYVNATKTYLQYICTFVHFTSLQFLTLNLKNSDHTNKSYEYVHITNSNTPHMYISLIATHALCVYVCIAIYAV